MPDEIPGTGGNRIPVFLEKKNFLNFPGKTIKHLQKLAEDFGPEDAQEIKQIEFTTNHDVKAVEYFLKNELEKCGGKEAKEWVHFGLTSQDINNTAIPLLWKHAIEYEYLPALLNLNTELKLLGQRMERYSHAGTYTWTTGQSHKAWKRNHGICGKNRKPDRTIHRYSFHRKIWRSHRQF